MRETMYAIRRADGEPIFGGWTFAFCDGPRDWELALEDADGAGPSVLYEMVEMTVEVVGTRIYPRCAQGCDRPAELWGLCVPCAKEDDPELAAEMLAARKGTADA